MQASRFNVQVPLPDRDEVFLMNTFSDAQLLVSPDVAGLLDRVSRGHDRFNDVERETVEALTRSIVAKLLHSPSVRLRHDAGTPQGERNAAAVSELFDLGSP